MWYIIKKLTSGSCFCKGHLFFEKAQLIAGGAEHMVLSTRNRRTLSTERTISEVHCFTSVTKASKFQVEVISTVMQNEIPKLLTHSVIPGTTIHDE